MEKLLFLFSSWPGMRLPLLGARSGRVGVGGFVVREVRYHEGLGNFSAGSSRKRGGGEIWRATTKEQSGIRSPSPSGRERRDTWDYYRSALKNNSASCDYSATSFARS